MHINGAKSVTCSIKGQPKQKNTVVEKRIFFVNGRAIPALDRSQQWKYLGVNFSPNGKCKFLPNTDLLPKLERLSKAPLKPQQRLHALRTVVVPQLYHRATLGSITIGSLNKADKTIRSEVRKWLSLPSDTPISFFHASVEHGGLGIPALRTQAPYLRLTRLMNLKLPSLADNLVANTFIARELDKAALRLHLGTQVLTTPSLINAYWASRLHQSVDGAGLREAHKYKQAHRWIREPTRLMTGRDFVNCVRLRINALASKSRTTRGRPELDRYCRAGCQASETTNHIVQQCHRTHGARIARHDAITAYIERSLGQRGYTTFRESRFETREHGLQKPDIVAVLETKALVIDSQIVTDGWSLDEAHTRKISKYNHEHLKRAIRQRHSVRDIRVMSATMNWRGIWSKASVNSLLDATVIGHRDTAILSTRVMIGSINCFRIFNTSTTVRQGIG
ncbi:hypothetical protein KPH14_013020 [Odynerus spinipes]|uniref:Reverse transcriptase n=1 Tax=Odynerus spinipes TaxID=1348599 RepID=A0AAD9VIH0_9HYME|nr:hypothetical protein KPH14_013020 [Odynerus spinipes]